MFDIYLYIVDGFSIDFRLLLYIFMTHVRTTVCVNRMCIVYDLHRTICKSYVNPQFFQMEIPQCFPMEIPLFFPQKI